MAAQRRSLLGPTAPDGISASTNTPPRMISMKSSSMARLDSAVTARDRSSAFPPVPDSPSSPSNNGRLSLSLSPDVSRGSEDEGADFAGTLKHSGEAKHKQQPQQPQQRVGDGGRYLCVKMRSYTQENHSLEACLCSVNDHLPSPTHMVDEKANSSRVEIEAAAGEALR